MRLRFWPALACALLVVFTPAGASTKKKFEPARQPTAGKPAVATAPIAKGRLYAIVLAPGTAWKRGQPFKGPGLEEHRRYWQRLHKEGRVASAGPLGGDTGLAVVRARDQREADALVAADPAVRGRILRGMARPYAAELVSMPVLVGR